MGIPIVIINHPHSNQIFSRLTMIDEDADHYGQLKTGRAKPFG